ncbi:helix-turn-helix transcriptional regulator [Streptomyces sp. NBC_00258]|uniref:helix-turn-helix transcriptional regulator n=1 Tax=Streptomyces sp. NBC_00258 TaxID=2903642 RepID=UPI002E2C1D77|nr:helix-turn-helix transcriptional regulator [Streptomyces sp. NBC_00258]
MARLFSGASLRDTRLLAGVSTAELAASVGRTPWAILKYETGTAQPPIVIADALAEALGVPLESLLVNDSLAVA